MERTTLTALIVLAISATLLAVIPSKTTAPASQAAIPPLGTVARDVAVTVDATATGDGAVAGIQLDPDPAYRKATLSSYSWVESGYVAHGMGGIGNKRVTNTLEAFEANYRRGYRVFEVDLVESTDGRLLARHDWGAYLYDFLGQPIDNPYRKLSTAEFKALPIHDKYTPLTIDDVMTIMRAYPDVWVMTDTKGTSVDEARAAMREVIRAMGDDTVLADRIIIQIYNERMLPAVQEIYPFRNIVYTLYQIEGTPDKAIEFARTNDIEVLAVPNTMWSEALNNQATSAKLHVAVYTVNDAKEAKSFRDSGVSVLYSDFLTPGD